LLVALALVPIVRGQEGVIEYRTGEILFQHGTRVSVAETFRYGSRLYRGSSSVFDPLDRRFWDLRSTVAATHGFDPRFSLTLSLPVIHREFEEESASGRTRQRGTGPGDLQFLGKFLLLKENWERSAFGWTLLGGLEVPTGRTDVTDGGVRIAANRQPGSGAWAPIVGTAATLELGRFRSDLSALYTLHGRGTQGVRPGDTLSLRLDTGYRFWMTPYPGPSGSAKLRLTYEHAEPSGGDPRIEENSGGDRFLLGVGLSFHPRPDIDLTLAIDIPVVRDLRGEQVDREVVASLAFGIRF
jgi:hypothetical protein